MNFKIFLNIKKFKVNLNNKSPPRKKIERLISDEMSDTDELRNLRTPIFKLLNAFLQLWVLRQVQPGYDALQKWKLLKRKVKFVLLLLFRKIISAFLSCLFLIVLSIFDIRIFNISHMLHRTMILPSFRWGWSRF